MEKYCRAGQATDESIIRHMRIACWIPKATNTHSEYVILIAFTLRQWMKDGASVLRHTYIACIVKFIASVIYPGTIIYNKPTRCSSGSIVFINNYKYAVHVSDALCVRHQEHHKL